MNSRIVMVDIRFGVIQFKLTLNLQTGVLAEGKLAILVCSTT